MHVHVGIAQFFQNQHARSHTLAQGPELFGRQPFGALAVKLRQTQHVARLPQRRVEFDDALRRNLVGDGKFLRDFACAGALSAAGLADDERNHFVCGLELFEDG